MHGQRRGDSSRRFTGFADSSIIAFALLTACLGGCQQPIPSVVEEADRSTPTLPVVESETERLNRWFDARYEERLFRSPMTTTRLGRKDQYDQIDDHSEAAAEELLQWKAKTAPQRVVIYSAIHETGLISLSSGPKFQL